MKAITSPSTVAVGDPATAAQANSYKTAIDAIVAREGARATTTATQTIAATTNTTLNNGGTNAWTATEDSGSFVSGTGGTTTPISIPAGKGGLYVVGVRYLQAATSGTRGFFRILINAAGSDDIMTTGHTAGAGCIFTNLNVGDTLGVLAFSTNATNISIGCQIYCYRLGN